MSTVSADPGTAPTADAAAFLSRLVRLDPAALVRLRPAGADRTALWAALPWGVLVTRTVDGCADRDRVTTAAALLAGAARLPERDGDWRLPLPPSAGRVLESLPVEVVRQAAEAAAATLREVEADGLRGRAVGQRVLRDALLDHVVITGKSDIDDVPFSVPQRLVQAVVRMGFLGTSGQVSVVTAGPWTGLAASFGTAWIRATSALTVRPIVTRPIG
ncbi:hypothetical protein [Catellatospora sp. TT07R-123]|uniref:hypothetical protein n=1 Tax=Catellatospora sp. TT07R-123 TaxID=2733863 RepID=UPI0027E48085|nr:hypothetical protein [Catellatospora sp. TT07R-123]